MKQSQQFEPRIPMVPRSVGLGVAILGTLVIVALMATFVITAF